MKKTLLSISILAITLASCSAANSTKLSSGKSAGDISATDIPDGNIVINMAVCNYSNWYAGNDPVKAFNEADNGYYINLVDYGEYYELETNELGEVVTDNIGEAYASADNQVVFDIIYEGGIDMIMNFIDDEKFISLAEKGAFADLDKFMENDTEINRNTLNSHILDLCELNDTLYYMPLSFEVNTMYGYEEYVGDNENWTISDMKSHWEQMPPDSSFTSSYGENLADFVFFDLCMNCSPSFMDLEKGKCRFDSNEFIELLRFANEFPKESMIEKTEMVQGDYFLSPVIISNFEQFHELLWNSNDPRLLSFVGYPSIDSSYSFIIPYNLFAICAAADQKVQQGAWEFLRYIESADYQYDLMVPKTVEITDGEFTGIGETDSSFPLNNEAFEKRAEEILSKEDENQFISMNGVEFNVGNLTREEYGRLIAIINNADRLYYGSAKIEYIIYEEVSKMLGGDITPEQAAANIQNRASIMLGE